MYGLLTPQLQILLVQILNVTDAKICKEKEPHSPFHVYHQLGDIIVGFITSQAYIIDDKITFNVEPPLTKLDEIMYEIGILLLFLKFRDIFEQLQT